MKTLLLSIYNDTNITADSTPKTKKKKATTHPIYAILHVG